MQKLHEQLKKPQLNIKMLVDWDDMEKVQKLTINLKQIQADLQTTITQSIQSHTIGKQKISEVISASLPLIISEKKNNQEEDNDLEGLVQMIQVRKKIDFCLEKLDQIVNKSSADDGDGK